MTQEISDKVAEEPPVLVERLIKRQRYQANRRAPIGTTIACANCGRVIVKKQPITQFCSTRGKKSCRKLYWGDA